MNLVQRISSKVASAIGGKSFGSVSNLPMNWFQLGANANNVSSTNCGVVEACVSAYAQTIAQCPIKHYKIQEDNSRIEIKSSNAYNILNNPNDYQTRSDFLMNLVHSLLKNGNSYFIGNGNTPRTHSMIALLDPRLTMPHRVSASSEYFYSTSGVFSEMAEVDSTVMIPSRFVGHTRLFTPNDPLVGVTPIEYAGASIAANNAITNHQASFFSNVSRPSGALSTDSKLNASQAAQLRKAWEEQSKGLNSGGVPILTNGLKWEAMSFSGRDSEIVDAWKMTVEEISRVFRVPPMMINNMENATFSNAEALMTFWLTSGLGFMIDHIEETFERFFNLPKDEAIELDTDVLLRTDLKARIEALGEGVLKALFTPNEARAALGLPPVEGGDTPYVQQQMIPLSAAAKVQVQDLNAPTLGNPGGTQGEEQPAEEETIEDEEPEVDDVEERALEFLMRKAA